MTAETTCSAVKNTVELNTTMEKASVSAEALLARGLAPIKREYIRKTVPRDADESNSKLAEQKNDNSTSKVASEKKSRRKMKKVSMRECFHVYEHHICAPCCLRQQFDVLS